MKRAWLAGLLGLSLFFPMDLASANVVWLSFLPAETGEGDAGVGSTGTRQMTFIGFHDTDNQSRVYARMNDTAKFAVREEGPNMVVLEIQNSSIPLTNNRRFMDSSFFNSPVTMITPSVVDDISPSIRIVVELTGKTPFSYRVEGRDIVLTFEKG